MIDDVSYVFGGYRTVAFSSGTGYRVDNDAFLFRLLEAGQWSPLVCKVKQGSAYAVFSLRFDWLIQQIFDSSIYGPLFGSNDLHMWYSNNYALGQQTNGSINVGHSYEQPAGAHALCGAKKKFVYTDFVAFHVKRVQAGCALF
jgi:hypothetical protein